MFGLIFVAVLVFFTSFMAIKNYDRRLSPMIILGILCFSSYFWLPSVGASIRWLELPPVSGVTTIKAPDGGFYTLLDHHSRVQVYDQYGEFLRGWFIVSDGGTSKLGLTSDGLIAVASARPGHIEMFDAYGNSPFPPAGYKSIWLSAPRSSTIPPDKIEALGLELIEVEVVDKRGFSFTTLLLFPIWHPFIGWFMLLIGGVSREIARRVS